MHNSIMNKKEIEFPKHSALIAMSNKITAIQRKSFDGLIYLAREQLKTNPINYKYSVSAKTLMDLIGIGEDNYTYLNEFLSKLHDIDVKYNIIGKDKKHKWGEFSMLAGYDYEKGMITYSFPHQIQDAIIDPNIYAWIDMVVIKGLKSKYALALYELAQDYVNVDHPITLELDRFRELMGVETDRYKKNIPMLRKGVIDKAVNELNTNEKIKFSISYELLKTGRRYTHIRLFVKRNSIHLQKKQQIKQKLEHQQLGLLLKDIPDQYRSKSAERLLKKYANRGVEYIRAQIECTNNANPHNYLAYLSEALKNDYAGMEKSKIAEQIAKKEKEKREQAARMAAEKRKEEEAKKRAAEEEEKRLRSEWQQLPDDEKMRYILMVAETNGWLRKILNSRKGETYEEAIKGQDYEEIINDMGMEEWKQYRLNQVKTI